jgi:esterase/lipase superfamily enzyme
VWTSIVFKNRANACLIGLLLTLTLTGCGARPGADVLLPSDHTPRFTEKVDMLVATTRAVGDPSNPFATNAARAKHLNFESHTVSIPTHHKAGNIEWPDQVPPDPTRHFITTDRQPLSSREFISSLRRRAQEDPSAGRVLIFVHGYNMLYQEAVYWMAQITHDSGFDGTPILFAWPSQGKGPLYVADRESTLYSRDYFERLLIEISKVPEIKHIDVLAHSMGTWLTVETLRQAAMKGHGHFNDKLQDVILASPDIDVNVFRTQLETIGPLPQPMTILVSGDDKALALSSALNGGVERVGMVVARDVRVLEGARRYNLRVVDLTNIDDDNDESHHNKFARSAPVIAAIGQGLASDDPNKKKSGVVSAVANVGTSIIKVPVSIFNPVATP